jgi:Ca2+-binding RTX toxin-like protein
LGAGESVIVDGSAETSAQLILAGGAGDDMLIGGAGINIFVSGAGVDTLIGGGSIDQYTLRGNLTAADQIDGKTGNDVVTLNGDYSAGIVFASTTMINVESMQFIGAFDYKLTLDDATATPIMNINGNGITGGHHLYLDASAEADAMLLITGSKSGDVIFGGGGNDKITANGGDDTIHGGGGNDQITVQNSLTATDRIDGGTEYDTLVLSGDYSAGVTFDADTMTNVEFIQLGIASTKLVLHDNTNNSSLLISGFNLGAGASLYVDGSTESSASLTVVGGDGGNTLIGGAGNDSFTGGSGADLLVGGAGNDSFFGYGGADIFSVDSSTSGIDVLYDFNLSEGTSLHITSVLDGAGDDIQDLVDAGFSAFGTGTDCMIGNGALTIYMYGFGGAVTDLNDLSALMGSQLVVAH